jgi:hypothetical protein
MTTFWHYKQSLILSGVFSFVLSCNGQIKTDSQIPGISAPIPKLIEQPKLVKTQGSTENDNVWCSLQDKSGKLWFGTTGEGVNRYNGKSFIQFTEKDGLNSNTVYSILEDKSGNIWIVTLDGICRFDGKMIT